MQCNLIPLIDSNASSFFFEFLKNIIEITNIFEYQFALNDKKVFDLLKLLHGYIDENQIYLALWRVLGIDERYPRLFPTPRNATLNVKQYADRKIQSNHPRQY